MPRVVQLRPPEPCLHDDGHQFPLTTSAKTPVTWCQTCGSLQFARSHKKTRWVAPQRPVAPGPPSPMALVPPQANGQASPPILSAEILALIEANKGIFLDVACGSHKSQGAIGMDIRPLANVDVVWNLEETPWPFPTGCAYRILMSHIVEHIKPWCIFQVFEEVHRILRPQGQVMIATPYPNHRFWMDPTHVHAWNETTCRYWDPTHPSGLWHVYEPSPFHVDLCEWQEAGDLAIVMTKVSQEASLTGTVS